MWYKTRILVLFASLRSSLIIYYYTFVIPISGGKDSTFVLYYAVKTLGLRAIAVNYDSGLQSDLAEKNTGSALGKKAL